MDNAKTTSRIFGGAVVPAPGVYTIDPEHTFVEFVAQHLVIGHVRGRFDRVTGNATVADDPTLSSLELSIETASVSTHNATRDEDLRSERFFYVDKYPVMTYRSSAVYPQLDGHWAVQGELTIRDSTHAVPVSMRMSGVVDDPGGNVRVGVYAQGQASRRTFGLLADLECESGGMPFEKDVLITVYAEALRKR